MSCHGCAEKFGFMKKEYGCPSCKFSYCRKCLRFQITDPKSKKQLQVCTKCHQMASATKEPIAVINALQRLESMDDPAKPPIIVYKQQTARKDGLRELRKGLSIEDQRLLERLECLKKDDITSDAKSARKSSEKIEEEIAERLARLKDEEYKPETKNQQSAMLRNIKPETEQDVIEKFAAEVEMDSRYQASVTNDIEERLKRLRGVGPSETNPPSTSSGGVLPDLEELTEEDQVKLILKKLQEELALDQKVGASGVNINMDVDDESEKPPVEVGSAESDDDIDVDELCGICSEKRATLICEECDDDIYCKACFQELHRDLGEVHAPRAFKKK